MADLLQIKILTSATISETFHLDGVPKDLDSGVPTVTITRPDGTTIASGTVTHVGAVDSGRYQFVLAGQPTPMLLAVTWTGTIGGQPQTLHSTVEILGNLLFTIPTFRALRVANGTPFSLTATPLYTDTQIMDARAAVLDELTDILGYSPVPRFARETHDVAWNDPRLYRSRATDLLSVSVAGTVQLVTGYYLHPAGILRPVSGYQHGPAIPSGVGSLTVEYVHGTERPPGNGGHVAMLWAAAQLNPSGFSSASTVTTPDGVSYTYEPSETGRGGFIRYTGIREVDRWLNLHRDKVAVA